MTTSPSPRSDVGHRIIKSAVRIVMEEGVAAATLRHVSKGAKVQLPQVYLHIGSMDDVLDAAAVDLWTMYSSTRVRAADEVNGLYDTIETLIEFGLTYPDIHLHVSKLRDQKVPGLWELQADYLKEQLRVVAKSGRLRVDVQQAAELLHPYCVGMVFTSIHQVTRPTDANWLALRAVSPLLNPDVLDISESMQARKASAYALALKANIGDAGSLTAGEAALLGELLTRIGSSEA